MYMARQPIFNRELEVYGYELLYRSTSEAFAYSGRSGHLSTASVLGNLFENGISKIVELFPSSHLIVEVLENVTDSEVVCSKLMELNKKGYTIALDDFQKDYHAYSLSKIARIIKFDLLATPLETVKDLVHEAKRNGKILLAEKVETNEVYEMAKAMGFDLFQGYFFCRPKNVGKSYKKSTTKNQYLRILGELEKEEPCYQRLAEIIEMDVTMSYRVLRVVGSRYSDDSVYSIKKALTYIGLNELKHWINVLMVQELCVDKPNELMRLSLIRSKFAEFIALRSKYRNVKFEASLLGLFSLIDAILDEKMESALTDSAISTLVKEALIKRQGPFKDLIEIIIAYEKGDWKTVQAYSKKLSIKQDDLLEDYKHAIEWAHTVLLLI
ncbi:EAL and HDOD domain-containing protein [Fusibacter sp. JL216-2]|uniref:EAL and HDOD domain-containing protein n=1 Tax=Fusibacter sp. JL216-2 TaxID=3071453 RepID=UPI003D327000